MNKIGDGLKKKKRGEKDKQYGGSGVLHHP
jgi:hypothetical protein